MSRRHDHGAGEGTLSGGLRFDTAALAISVACASFVASDSTVLESRPIDGAKGWRLKLAATQRESATTCSSFTAHVLC
ncbi:hypothetical protein [Sorangium sp. So ce1389]|uniref:hypothetical protein n=1 Tax=Sorangium sp. So ce1389 TaxID=3133336 RepID=UPI003F62E2A8